MMDIQNFFELTLITFLVIGGLAFILGLYTGPFFRAWLRKLRTHIFRPRYLKRINPKRYTSPPSQSPKQ